MLKELKGTSALIPARKGSKGIPGKNMKLFKGKPLVQWSIDQAKDSKLFDNIIVSSDDAKVLKLAEDSGCTAWERHPGLCNDEATLDEVLVDHFFRQENHCEYICLLQPTSPLRAVEDIVKSYRFIKMKKWVSVVGVTWNPVMGWIQDATKHGSACLYLVDQRPNRQNRAKWFLENGAIYWVKSQALFETGDRVCNPGQCKLYEMPPERSLEIDSPFDWYMAERAYEYTRK